MNNEFKKISKDDTTRYVLESASSGGTSSGSVATVSKALGGVQRRGGNLLVQDASQKLTPRSPVAHAAQKVAKGSGRHTDRKQQSKQVRGEKHKGRDFAENQDHEISMAGSELHSIFQNAKQLHSMIKAKSEEDGLDAWQQSKITKAADYLNSVLQSLQHEMMGEQGVAEGSIQNKTQKKLAYHQGMDDYENPEVMASNHKSWGEYAQYYIKGWKSAQELEAGSNRDWLERQPERFDDEYDDEQGVAEGGPFSYGKPPRKGSVAANAAQKRKEQDRKTPPIEPKNQHVGVAKVIKDVKEGRLNEFAPDGFGGDDDGEGFDPYMAQMAEEDGLVKGVSLVDGATLEQAMKIQYWHSRYGGMYKHYFAKGFKKGRLDKIRHNNKQYNLNLQLNKDGSVSHGEQDMEEARVDQLPTKGADYSDYDTDHLKFMLRPGILHRNEARFKALIRKELKKREQQSQQGVAEGVDKQALQKELIIINKLIKDMKNSWQVQHLLQKKEELLKQLKQGVAEDWSQKYKNSINCSHPRGFSQKAHCAGKRKHNESLEMEMTCPDCGMCATHGNNMMEVKQRLDAKCWKGKHKEGTKIKGGVRVNNCVPNESVAENQINELDRPSGKLFIIVKADNAGATHVFGDFGSFPQDVMHKVSKRGTRDKAGVKTKLKIDFLFDNFRSTIQQLRAIFRDLDFVGAEAAEFIIHSSALRSEQGEDVKHLRDYIENGDDRRMKLYQKPEEDDEEDDAETSGGNILRIDPETGAARKVTGVKPQTQMGGKSAEQPGMTTYKFKDPRFAQQLRGMNLGFNIKGDSITVDQKQKQKLLSMLGNKFSDVFTDKERFKEQDASEAMLPKSAFAGSDKNKLGPAAHLKGSMRRPARQGDLVGGDAQESINLGEKAVSQQQQKFFGMVHAMQKGKKIPGASPELKKTAKSISKSDAKDFAKTKHAGLPKKVKEGGMSLPPAGMTPEQARDFANAQMAGQQAINQHAAQQANTPPRGVNFTPDYLEKAASGAPGRWMISVDDAKIALDWLAKNPNYRPPVAAQPSTPTTGSGYSREYLEKAADPNRFGRYMISVEKAQELLGQMKEDTYMESLAAALEQKLNINDPPETWRDDFEHADPVKYKQFRNKTVEKKHRMADVARYRQIQQK